eukprot:6203014-Pleurochrysis_carterae.AAC.1
MSPPFDDVFFLALAAYCLHATSTTATGTLQIYYLQNGSRRGTHMAMISRPTINVRASYPLGYV